MEILINSLQIAIIMVTIIDFVQFIEPLKRKLFYLRYTKDSDYTGYNFKPFDCSPCASFWGFIAANYFLWELGDPFLIFMGACGSSLIAIGLRKYLFF